MERGQVSATLFFGILFIVAIVLAIFLLPKILDNSTTVNKTNEENLEITDSNQNSSQTSSKEYTIEIISSGFSPETLGIKKGDTIVFVNNMDSKSWPASNIHPTHKSYPNSDIKKCGTFEKKIIFDACKELRNGETYEFIFNEIWRWDYHD